MRKISILFIILIILSIGWWYMVTHPAVVQAPVVPTVPTSTITPEPLVTTTAPIVASTPESKIILDTLKPGDTVNSPLTITGKARGTWYFEGSFPVELRDSNNVQLAIQPATATSDWMTTNWVPFTATLNFPASTTGMGLLIFHKDNPSDDPARDEAYQMVVEF